MDKISLIALINKDYSINDIAKELNKSKTTIRYWLKKYKLKTSHPFRKNKEKYIRLINDGEAFCSKCEKNKPIDEFYNTEKSIKNHYPYCKSCSNIISVKRQRDIKLKCLKYKGGCCVFCGYDKYYGALEFHHINPKEKDFTIAVSCKSFNNLLNELDKCILVCSNCHKELHAGLIDINSLKIV